MEPQHHRGHHTGGRHHYYYCDEDDDFSAEELFNMFFGHSGRIHMFFWKIKYKFFWLFRCNNSNISTSSPTKYISFYYSFNTKCLFFINFRNKINFSSLDNTYIRSIITLFITLSYFHSRNIICRWTKIPIISDWVCSSYFSL